MIWFCVVKAWESRRSGGVVGRGRAEKQSVVRVTLKGFVVGGFVRVSSCASCLELTCQKFESGET